MQGAGRARTKLWWALSACVVLAGAISCVAFMLQRHTSSFRSRRTVWHTYDGELQDALPKPVFRPSSNRVLRNGQRREPNLLNSDDGIVGTVGRIYFPSVATSMEVTIPRTIWQTARSSQETPHDGVSLFNSWSKLNPAWDHFFMDDEDIDAFVAAHYNNTVLEAFRDMPLGVMRADAFRYTSPRTHYHTEILLALAQDSCGRPPDMRSHPTFSIFVRFLDCSLSVSQVYAVPAVPTPDFFSIFGDVKSRLACAGT